jgi:hypothetical protein
MKIDDNNIYKNLLAKLITENPEFSNMVNKLLDDYPSEERGKLFSGLLLCAPGSQPCWPAQSSFCVHLRGRLVLQSEGLIFYYIFTINIQ